MEAMLEIAGVVTAYGKIEALKGVSLSANRGRITCLLGPNGAGKTTLMMTTAGVLKPRQGSIKLEGNELVGLSPARIVGNGVALVPENRLVFPQMSVRENLLAGAYQRNDSGEGRRRCRTDVCTLSASEGAPRAACRNAVRWRAANAGGGARADVASAASADG